ncbi:MAG: ArnT family glycosyltransferase [Alphaproteobacteria bacterium]
MTPSGAHPDPATHASRRRIGRRCWLLIAAGYLAVNLILAAFTTPGAAQRHGGDAASWYGPGFGIAKLGAFVHIDTPDKPELRRGPLYPLLIAGTVLAADKAYFRLLVPIQILLLFATAMIAARFTETLLPGYGMAALALVAFNPNALGTAHLVQSETLYALLVTLLAWAILAYCRSPGLRPAALAGLALGFSCLVRPEGQFLILALPLAMLILPSLPGPALAWRRRLAPALVAGLVALVAISPWLWRNHEVGHGYRLSTYESMSYYLWGSAGQIEMIASGVSEREAEKRMAARRADFIARQGEGWKRLGEREQYRRLAYAGLDAIRGAEAGAIARVVIAATLQFFAAGGAGDLHNLVGLEASNPYQKAVTGGYSSYENAWLASLRDSAPATLAISIIALGFVVLLRILGIAGMVTLARRREWRVLLVLGAAIAYFALVIPFYGNSRFRVGIEPLLILLALYGFSGLREVRRRRRTADPARVSAP